MNFLNPFGSSVNNPLNNPFKTVAGVASGGQVPSEPSFTVQPTDLTIGEMLTAVFTSLASGYPIPTYQWQLDSGSGFANISGETNRILTLVEVELSDDGNEYRVIATNSEGSATSEIVTLTVTEANGLLSYNGGLITHNNSSVGYV